MKRSKLELLTEGTVRASTVTDEVKSLQLQIELELGEKLIVPKRLTNPDSLIQITIKSLAGGRNGWASNDFRHIDELSIATSDRHQARALRFFDTLIKAFRFRKHDIRIGHRATEVILFGERIEVKLNEKRKMVKDLSGSYLRTTYESTGIHYFTARPYYSG